MFWRIFIIQHIIIVLFLISGQLAAPFADNRIEPSMYVNNKCNELSFPLSMQCSNHWWILPVDHVLFLPGFMGVLLWPLMALFAFVIYHKKNEHKFKKRKGHSE